jgi:hypothetical protein
MKKLAVLLLAILPQLMACASAPPAPTATDPDDANIHATVLAVYNVISGPAGRRDWDRFKDLFAPGARMISVRNGAANVMTPDDYINKAKPYFDQNGFFERPSANRTVRFRDIAHVFSTYESRHNANDATPFARGINSFQLVRIGEGWKVLTILWQEEDAAHPIPAPYLPKP